VKRRYRLPVCMAVITVLFAGLMLFVVLSSH
jgi:hypothetical protein